MPAARIRQGALVRKMNTHLTGGRALDKSKRMRHIMV